MTQFEQQRMMAAIIAAGYRASETPETPANQIAKANELATWAVNDMLAICSKMDEISKWESKS